jgi:DNA-binding response OmpR family regulator
VTEAFATSRSPAPRRVPASGDERPTLLVAETSGDVCQVIEDAYPSSQLRLVDARNGAEALFLAGVEQPGLFILADDVEPVPVDLITQVLRTRSSAPILIAVGPGGDIDVAGRALIAGATSIVGRPADLAQLAPVIKKLVELSEQTRRDTAVLRYGPIELDPGAFSARLHGVELALPRKEFELLRIFMHRPNHVIPTEELLDLLWPEHDGLPSSNAFSVHLARLRQRVGGTEVLRTVRGVGYRLSFDEG